MKKLTNFIHSFEINVPKRPLNYFIKKIIKPMIDSADLQDIERLEFSATVFDKADKAFDFAFGSKTDHFKINEAIEVERIDSARHDHKPTDTVILMVHGGGFVSFSPRSHRVISAYLSYYTGATVYAPNYIKSYKKKYPAQLNECLDTYKWLLQQEISPSKIVLVGDSAGGNLCLSMCHAMNIHNIPKPAGVVCYSPWTDLTQSGPSLYFNKLNDNVINPDKIEEVAAFYCPDPAERKSSTVSPFFGDFSDFPPTQIHYGTREVLASDSIELHKKLIASGIKSDLVAWAGQGHVFPLWAKIHKHSRECLKQTADFIGSVTSL